MSLGKLISQFDFFPKYEEEMQKKTIAGGAIAIASCSLMVVLYALRLNAFVNAPVPQSFYVNSPRLPFKSKGEIDHEKLPKMNIFFDLLIYHHPCSFLHVEVIDSIKETDDSYKGTVKMERFNQNGDRITEKHYPKNEEKAQNDYCGSCYGQKSGCCNTCKDVRKAFKANKKPIPSIASIEQCVKEGYLEKLKEMANESCRLYGSIEAHQYPGILHVATSDDIDESDDIYKRIGIDVSSINLSHKINHFSIGTRVIHGYYPLDGNIEIQKNNGRLKMIYHIRAVPIESTANYFKIGASKYQNYRRNTSTKYPGIFFSYDISPIGVKSGESEPLFDFIVEIFSILGGVFAVSAFLDSLIYSCGSMNSYLPKVE